VNDSHGVIKGYVDILPVKEQFADGLIAGSKKEADITPSDLIGERQIKEGHNGYIYVAAIVAREAQTVNPGERGVDRTFSKLVLATIHRLQDVLPINPSLSKILALSYQKTSEDKGAATDYLLEFGFTQVGKSSDGYPAYLLNMGRGHHGFEKVFSASSIVRERWQHKNRRRRKIFLLVFLFMVLVGLVLAALGRILGIEKLYEAAVIHFGVVLLITIASKYLERFLE